MSACQASIKADTLIDSQLNMSHLYGCLWHFDLQRLLPEKRVSNSEMLQNDVTRRKDMSDMREMWHRAWATAAHSTTQPPSNPSSLICYVQILTHFSTARQLRVSRRSPAAAKTVKSSGGYLGEHWHDLPAVQIHKYTFRSELGFNCSRM